MGKQRSSLRQVPWQSWEHWNWVATELFSDSPERISGALDRIAAWQSRGKVPIAVETSAAIIGIHQRDPQLNHGMLKESPLPEEMLRMMYAMAIQRLVNGVVDQSQKRNTTSVADRAEFAGLPRLLVDIRHEAAHTELPGLALLQVASKQALAWLKLQYWDQQKETLVNVRLELKSKLVEHCLLVVDILNPSPIATNSQQSEEEQESESKVEVLPEVFPQESLRVKRQLRKVLFKELLDLSLSSMLNLVSTLVDDGLLEQDSLPIEEEVQSKQSVRATGSTDGTDLASAMDSAWKLTLRELSSHLSRLPEMLLVAIVKHINKNCPRSGKLRRAEGKGPTSSQAPDLNIDESTDPGSMDSLQRNRLITWCSWLLGKRFVQASEDSTENDPRKSKLLKISNSLFVKPNLSKEILADLLRLCLSTSNGQEPLVGLVTLIAVQLGNERYQHRVAALAQLGTSMRRLHRNVMDTSENQVASLNSVREERSQEGSVDSLIASSPAGRDDASLGSESTTEPAFEVARRQQRAFFARLSSQKHVVQSTRDGLRNEEQTAGSPLRFNHNSILTPSVALHKGYSLLGGGRAGAPLRQEGPEIQRWTVVENWRPCAIGMIPSPCHSLGILPSLDFYNHVHGTERGVPMTAEGSRETSASTTAAREPVDKIDLATGGMVEPVVGKRTTDEQVDRTRRKKIQKVGRLVHFEGDSPMEVDEEGVVNASGVIPNRLNGQQQEHTNTGSLLQGCLLQQGMFIPITPQQFESLKAAVRVL